MEIQEQLIRNVARSKPITVQITDDSQIDFLTIFTGVARIPAGWKVVPSDLELNKQHLSDVTSVMSDKR